jgi:cytosine/adenosine deaminase-related metal-dependent hydrolase
MLLRARIVLPVTAPPIEDGAVFVSGSRLGEVGRWSALRRSRPGPVCDLGEVILLPGLINAHCHLDYTLFAAHLPPPRRFTDWIQGVLALKAGWSYSDYAASWLEGARQLLRGGCTTVVDVEAVPELLPEVWHGTALRVVSALEMTNVRSQRPAAEVVEAALSRARSLIHPRSTCALAPHAPYSTRQELLTRVGAAARAHQWTVTTHVAESAEEFEMFQHRRGPMFKWLSAQRDMSDCGGISPVGVLQRAGFLQPRCLLAHANCLADEDAGLIAQSGASVVHCPRSHDYFRHPPFPYERLAGAGVNLCLGTDSLLSTRKRGRALPQLELSREMELFAQRHPQVRLETILQMVTVNAARAIGREGALGTLAPGACADLIALRGLVEPGEAASAIVQQHGGLVASMIGGQWAVPPPDAPPARSA